MKRRVLGFGSCCYHVVSRINENRFYLDPEQKKVFVDLLKRCVTFSGIELLTYCIMDNHFHLLIHVPQTTHVSDKILLRRLKALYAPREYDALEKEFNQCCKTNSEELRYAFRQRYLHRMYNLSEFMSTLKQRFSITYNKKKERQGPLWNGRFKSVLIQSSKNERGTKALALVASYIDLNAVRADLVDDPKEYAWCGYADAIAGDHMLRKGIRYIYSRTKHNSMNSALSMRHYARLLDPSTYPEKLPTRNMLLDRLCSLSSGWIFGDKSFVDFVVQRRPECFPGRKYCSAKRVAPLAHQEMWSMMYET